MLVTEKSKEAFKQALESISDAVNSPVRAFGAARGNPIFIESGRGYCINDVDGTKYVNYESAKRSDTKRYAYYFHGMLERGF